MSAFQYNPSYPVPVGRAKDALRGRPRSINPAVCWNEDRAAASSDKLNHLQQQQRQRQQQVPAVTMIQQEPHGQVKGHCILRLVQFGDHLSKFVALEQRDDLAYWSEFVETFFSPRGVLRHSVWASDEGGGKQYQITYPALARYFNVHFESGISKIQMIIGQAKEKELPYNCHYVESQKSRFIYWFENRSQLVAHGVLHAQFDINQKMELLEFITSSHEEYIPRTRAMDTARSFHEWAKEWHKANALADDGESPQMNKTKSGLMKSPLTAPPELDIPESKVQLNTGITPSVLRFLELADIMGQMNPLFRYSHQNPSLPPHVALEQYVTNIASQDAMAGSYTSEEDMQLVAGMLSDDDDDDDDDEYDSDDQDGHLPHHFGRAVRFRAPRGGTNIRGRAENDRARLEKHHPELLTMWTDLEKLPAIKTIRAEQPKSISRELKPFQLEGLSWMQAMEKTEWAGGLLGDEMGMGKTIQAVSLIMSDYPAQNPSLVLIPPVALMQWQQEIGDYTDGTLKTFVFHATNKATKDITTEELKKYDVILISYNSLESMYRHQEKGFKIKNEVHFQKSIIHQLLFHRVILDEAHNIKTQTTGVAKACCALKADYKWCLSGTPLQNRIGELFSLVRFLGIRPFICYFCRQCPCSISEWSMTAENRCIECMHSDMQHVSVFNQELLSPIQKFGNKGPGKVAFDKLRLLTDRFMLRRVKRDYSAVMELPAKEIQVDRQFFSEEENDFAANIMNNSTRKFETYISQGVLLNNYANIFGLIMQMRQVADHPDLIVTKNAEGGQNILVCCICSEAAEEPIRSTCRHDFCRSCAKYYLESSEETIIQPDCPQCHIPLIIDLDQPEMEQDEQLVKKSSIINRIKMENWTSSTKIEVLVHKLYQLRSHKSSHKSIIFSQFTTMLQLVEWRLRRAGITTVMLDGSMTPAQRQASINHFKNDVNVECFLVSLRAGGVALNLTEASQVFIVDPWWNPAAEWQSADRCHRIGQSRPCKITRLCIEDSVESRMVLLQEKKAHMINSTINADEKATESLTSQDMQFLFRGN